MFWTFGRILVEDCMLHEVKVTGSIPGLEIDDKMIRKIKACISALEKL